MRLFISSFAAVSVLSAIGCAPAVGSIADDGVAAELAEAGSEVEPLDWKPAPGAYKNESLIVKADSCAGIAAARRVREVEFDFPKLAIAADDLDLSASCALDDIGIASCAKAEGPSFELIPNAEIRLAIEIPVLVRDDLDSFKQITLIDVWCIGDSCAEVEEELDIEFPCQTELLEYWRK